ncbi:MAG: flagellar biosynthetic protein FliR [Rhodospirillaceae bacterium]
MATLQTLIAGQLFAWLLIFTRVGSAFMVMPVFGDQFVPARARLLLALIISVIVTPALQNRLPPEPNSIIALTLLILGEVLVGVFVGSLPRLMFGALEVAGMIIAMQAGLSNAFVFNPSLASQGSLPGSLMSWLALLLIMVGDLHHLLLMAVIHSYDLFQPGAPLPVSDFMQMVSHLVSQSFMIGVEMSAPFLATGLVFALALGIMARLAPQMQVFFVFMSAQIAYGLFLFAITVSAMITFWLRHFESTLVEFINPR